MARKFFVGGNFKMNPTSLSAAVALAKNLAEAQLDPNTGASSTDTMSYRNTTILIPVLMYSCTYTRPQRPI